jgi:hypothetical protein
MKMAERRDEKTSSVNFVKYPRKLLRILRRERQDLTTDPSRHMGPGRKGTGVLPATCHANSWRKAKERAGCANDG